MILFFGNTANVVYFFIAQYIFNFFTFTTFIGITGHLAKKEKVVLYTEKQLMMEKNNPVKKTQTFSSFGVTAVMLILLIIGILVVFVNNFVNNIEARNILSIVFLIIAYILAYILSFFL